MVVKSDFLGLVNVEWYILIGGSIYELEELILFGVYKVFKEVYFLLLLILVLCYLDCFDIVLKLIEKVEFIFVKSVDNLVINDDCDVLLVNEMGWLNVVYDVVDIVFVGGSIV